MAPWELSLTPLPYNQDPQPKSLSGVGNPGPGEPQGVLAFVVTR